MTIIILVVLILMNGVGYWGNATVPGSRYGYGGLGFLLLIILFAGLLGFIPLK